MSTIQVFISKPSCLHKSTSQTHVQKQTHAQTKIPPTGLANKLEIYFQSNILLIITDLGRKI